MTKPHTARRPATEKLLDQHKVAWTFQPDHPIDSIDLDGSLANQVREQPLDDEVVARYAADLERGDTFPAVIVNRVLLVGGNHTTHAHIAADRTTIAAYLIDVDDDTAFDLAIADNRDHGLPATPGERARQALRYIDRGLSRKDAAIVGATYGSIQAAVDARSGAVRATKLRLAGPFDGLAMGHQRRLAHIDQDKVFAAAVRHTAAHRLNQAETHSLVTELGAARDTADALNIIERRAAEREDNARSRVDGRIRPTERARLQRHLTGIQDVSAADVAACIDDPTIANTVDRQITSAARRLVEIRKALQAATT